MHSNNKLETFIENPKRALWKLTIPMMLGLFVNSIYMLVDTFFVGSKIGSNALSALGYVMPFYFIVMGITFGLSSGVTAVIAQYIGKQDKLNADQSAQNSLVIATIMAIINLLFVYFFGERVLASQNMSLDVLGLAMEYFYVMAYGSIFLIYGIFLRSILVGEGESIIPMTALGIGTIMNIFLDPFFIEYWGIKGAAYATVVSQIFVVLIFVFFIFIRKSIYLDLSFSKFKIDFKIWRKIFNIGVPGSLSMLIMSIGLFIMNYILTDSSSAYVAAYSLANRLENFIILALVSLSTSQVTIVGMFYGAKRFDLIKPIVNYTTIWSIIITLFFSIISFLFIENITPYFTIPKDEFKLAIEENAGKQYLDIEKYSKYDLNDDQYITSEDLEVRQQTIDTTVSYYKVMAFIFPFIGITMVSTRSLQGIGMGTPMLMVAISRVLIIQCILAFVFIKIWDKPIIWAWYAIAISCIASSIIAYSLRLYFLSKLTFNK